MSKGLDEIAQEYAVKVGFNDNITGSGVLVKSEDNTCYLFTAKHNFKIDNTETHKDVKKETIISSVETIYIEKIGFGEIKVFMKELLFFDDDVDLVVFLLAKNEVSYIQELPLISIFKDELSKEYDYSFYGYPKNAEDGFLSHGQYNLHNEMDNIIFHLLDIDKYVDSDAVLGYSGSGVFLNIKDTEEVYLVGILIRADEGIPRFEIIDLGRVIELDIPIQLATSDGLKPDKIDKDMNNDEYHLTIECIPKNEQFEVSILTQYDNRMKNIDDRKTYTKNEIAILIDKYVKENKPTYIHNGSVFLLFVLPISLMSENIGSWKVGEDKLADKYTIMLRGQERFRDKNKHLYASLSDWKNDWKNCQDKEKKAIKKIIYKKYDIDNTGINSGMMEKYPLIVFGYNLNTVMFQKLYRAGVSKAMWVGSDANMKKFKKLFKKEEYKQIEFGKLHNNLCEFKEKEKKIGSHIMFLYDNPNDLPLDDSDMAQINPI